MGDLIRAEPVQPLDPAVVTVWRAIAAALAIPLVILATGGALATGQRLLWLVALAVVPAAVVAIVWIPRAVYERFRWGVEDGVLRIQHGILFRTQASVPAFRIQHIDLTQGPLDRWAGIQHLVVHTAAPAADLELPGIATADAPRVRAELLDLARGAAPGPDAHGTVDAV